VEFALAGIQRVLTPRGLKAESEEGAVSALEPAV
jgi:hypothetical protein